MKPGSLHTHLFCDLLYSISNPHNLASIPCMNGGDFEIDVASLPKSESEISDLIQEYIMWVGIHHEREFCLSTNGEYVLADFALFNGTEPSAYIEVKRNHSGIQSAIGQLLTYQMIHDETFVESSPTLILIAPKFNHILADMCNKHGIVAVSICERLEN